MADLTQFKPTLGDNDYPVLLNNLIDQLQITETEVSGSSGTSNTLSTRLSGIDLLLSGIDLLLSATPGIGAPSKALVLNATSSINSGIIKLTAGNYYVDNGAGLSNGILSSSATKTPWLVPANAANGLLTAKGFYFDNATVRWAFDTAINLPANPFVIVGVTVNTTGAEFNYLFGANQSNNVTNKALIRGAGGDVRIVDADAFVSLQPINSATGTPGLKLNDDVGNLRAFIYRAATFNGMKLDVRDASGAVKLLMQFEETGKLSLTAGHFDFNTSAGQLKIGGVTIAAQGVDMNRAALTSYSNNGVDKNVIKDLNGFLQLPVGQLKLGGTVVTPTAAELNVLDSPTVLAITLNSGFSLVASTSNILVPLKGVVFDRNSNANTTNGTFSVVTSGYYNVSISLFAVNATFSITESIIIKFATPTVTYLESKYTATGNSVSTDQTISASGVVFLLSGNNYGMYASNLTANAIALSVLDERTYMRVHRVA